MIFKLDENLPLEAAFILREAGFSCETVWDESLSGANARRRSTLVTLDLDFSNIQVYPPDQYVGIVVLRPKTQDKETVLTYIQKLMAVLRERTPAGELWIVQRDPFAFDKRIEGVVPTCDSPSCRFHR